MKKTIFLALSLLIFQFTFAQKKNAVEAPPELPIDNVTHLITYDGVLEVKGVSAHELYQRMQQWFRSYYKNPKEVIREEDSVANRMTGKPRFRIQQPADKNGLRTDAGLVQYTISVATKDGRYRYQLSEFNWKQASYYACERWLDTNSPSWNPAYNEYLRQVDSTVEQVLTSLQEALSTAKGQKSKDDW